MFLADKSSGEYICSCQPKPELKDSGMTEKNDDCFSECYNRLIINFKKNKVMLTVLEVALLLAIIIVPLTPAKSRVK